VRNWEVTQVNELLEQLGEFEGIVLLATNRLEALDPAALRRMVIKVRFDPLDAQQVRHSFGQLCRVLEVQCCARDLEEASALTGLTPGDFACVARRMALARLSQCDLFGDLSANSANSAYQLLKFLAEEIEFKAPTRQEVGFVTQGRSSKS
jgi:hypothetical protein